MKYILFCIGVFFSTVNAQVGIGTTSPTAMLDINGKLRIRDLNQEADMDVITDSILVISKSGEVNRIEANNVVAAALPTMVKVGFSNTGNVVHGITGLNTPITFNSEELDSHDEYDTSTYTFTAKQAGIYVVSGQIKIVSAISVNTNFGIGIYKNNVLIAEHSYTSVVVSAVSVSSPIRHVNTVISLSANDTIQFKVSSTLLSVNILGTSTDSYCSIYQLR